MCSVHTEITAPILPFPCEFFPGRTSLCFLCDLLWTSSVATLLTRPLPTLTLSPRMLWQPLEPVWYTFFCSIKISTTSENIAFLIVALEPPFVSALLVCFRCWPGLNWCSALYFWQIGFALLTKQVPAWSPHSISLVIVPRMWEHFITVGES